MPVIPATRKAEAGELPEPRRRRLRWAEIAPLHSSLGDKSKTPSQKKKKEDTQAADRHEKKLNVTNYQRNTNQNHHEASADAGEAAEKKEHL